MHVVGRAVHKDPSARFPSARAFADALSVAAEGAGALASHEEVGSYVARGVGAELALRREGIDSAERRSRGARQRRRAAIVGVAFVVAAGGLALAFGRTERAPAAATAIGPSSAVVSAAVSARESPDPEPPLAPSFALPASAAGGPARSPRP